MTLSVTVNRRDPTTGALIEEPADTPGETLAGFEIWRTAVYGSPAVRRRGARYLPNLAHTDVVIEGNDLTEFVAECTALLRDVEALAIETGVEPEMLRFRLANLLRAAEKAQAIAGLLWIS